MSDEPWADFNEVRKELRDLRARDFEWGEKCRKLEAVRAAMLAALRTMLHYTDNEQAVRSLIFAAIKQIEDGSHTSGN